MPRAVRLAVPLLLAAFAGCASEDLRRFPTEQGWVKAWVMQVDGELPTPLREADDCRRQDDAGAGNRYVEVAFWKRGFSRRRIVRLPSDGPSLHKGDIVHVNVQDCSVAPEL